MLFPTNWESGYSTGRKSPALSHLCHLSFNVSLNGCKHNVGLILGWVGWGGREGLSSKLNWIYDVYMYVPSPNFTDENKGSLKNIYIFVTHIFTL